MWASFAVFCIALASATSSSVASKQFHLDPEHCSFSSDRYSVQWAYEPHSKNVVFVLKQRSELKNFWTGIGFGDRKKEVIDFIGVFVKNGQIGIADTYINPDEGTIHPDASTNVQSIAFDYDVINKTVTAKFARSLKSPDIDFDRSLDKCITFNFAYRGGRITRADIRPDLDELIEKRVCDIAKYCEVDLHSSATTDEPVRAPATLKDDDDDHIAPMVIQEAMPGDSREAGSVKDKPEKPEIAASVDISGTGDPCSFTGAGYTVDWTYDPDTDLVDFVMKHRVRDGKWWSAVGIGDNMSDMDIAIIFVSYGRPKRIRDYFSNSYGVPTLDETQDWTLSKLRTKSVDGMVELGFSRKLETDDAKKDRSLDGCVLFQFAANAGHYSTGFEVRKHEEWPDLYKACDIKTKCVVKDADKHGLPETSDNLDESTEDEEVENVVVMDKRAKKPKPEESEAEAEEEVVEEETVTEKPKKGNGKGNGNGKKNNKNNNKKKTTTTAAPTTTEATTTESSVDETLAADEVLEGKSGTLDEMDESATTNLIIQSELNGLATTTAGESDATEATSVVVEGSTVAPEAEASESETTAIPEVETTVASEAQTTVASEAQTAATSEETTVAPEAGTTVTSEGSTIAPISEPLAFEVSQATSEAETTASPSDATTVAGVETTLPEAEVVETAESSTLPSISFDAPGAATTTEASASDETTAWTERTVQFVTFTYPPHIMPMVNGELNPFYKPTEPSDATTEATTGSDKATTGAAVIGGEPTTAAIAAGVEATTQFRGLMAITMSSEEASAESTGAPESAEASQETGVDASATTDAVTSDSVVPLANDPSTAESSTVPASVSPSESVPSDSSTAATSQLSGESPASDSSTVSVPESSPESSSSESSAVLGTNESSLLTTPSGSEASEPTPLPSLADILGGITGAPSGEAVTGESAATSDNSEASESSEESSTLPPVTTAVPAGNGGIPGEDGNPVDTGIGDVVVPEEEFIHEPNTGAITANATENESSNSIENENESAITLAAEVDGSGEDAEEGETTVAVSGTTESSVNNAVDDASSVTLSLTPITVTLDVTTTTTAVPSGAGSETGNSVSDSEAEATTESESSSEFETTSESTPETAAATTQAIVPLESTSENTSDGPEVEGSGESAENIDTTTATIELSSTPEPGPFTGTDEELRAQLGDAAIGDPKKEGCGTGHEDYSLCGAYFTNYLDRVRTWAETNNEPYEEQFGKACTLLSQVRNVKTLCCTIFVDTCKGKIEF